ncbi:MAG: hypothetical protein M1816_002762 [Peltula sp. TS41687]|nr:MAG: hypothetical protein M1816_002762 [Peltula sp. TS41687]
MDPISITASAVTVATLAANTCRAFAELRAVYRSLPGRLHALNNEVADIEVVLYRVATVLHERHCSSPLESESADIPLLLKQASTKLRDLKNIVDNLTVACNPAKAAVFRVNAWRKEQGRLQALQDDIKTVKCSLNIMLGASNSRDMMRVRLDLKGLVTVTSQSVQGQAELRDEFLSSLSRHQDLIRQDYQQVATRIGRVEELLKAQSERFEENQSNQIGPFYRSPRPDPRQYSSAASNMSTPSRPARAEGVGVQVAQYSTTCRAGCACACHVQKKSATPTLINRVLGQLFIGYAGLPLLSSKCNMASCEKSQGPRVSVEYWFPLGVFWSQIIQLQVGFQSNIGPQFQLRTFRRVPDSAQCVNFALDGNIEGLIDLFKRGLASPRDVSETRGYTLLRWALYGQQYETCKFLVHAGADADYRPLSKFDNSPRNKASDIVLQGGLPREVVDALTCLTAESDWIEDQNFTLLHKIVTGLSMQDLEGEILSHPENINATDAMGRTPLLWAAARGDERSAVMLLSHGADANIMDIQCAGPVSYAADRGHTVCVRLLLEAGADPDPEIPGGYKLGSALNCAARNTSDPLILKTLLDFGADIEACGVDGKTSLIHAARTDNASYAMLLLEYGANINAISTAGQTPLTTAITYNSHNVLQLLLDRWFEYSECPRLKGPHLLETVAFYADLKTITILTATDHFKLKYDKSYVLGDCTSQLRSRFDSTEKLIMAFDDLLSVINQNPESTKSAEDLMESGLLAEQETGRSELGSEKHNDNDDWDSASFEDALENLQLGAHSG